jgi:hypothetical protein
MFDMMKKIIMPRCYTAPIRYILKNRQEVFSQNIVSVYATETWEGRNGNTEGGMEHPHLEEKLFEVQLRT